MSTEYVDSNFCYPPCMSTATSAVDRECLQPLLLSTTYVDSNFCCRLSIQFRFVGSNYCCRPSMSTSTSAVDRVCRQQLLLSVECVNSNFCCRLCMSISISAVNRVYMYTPGKKITTYSAFLRNHGKREIFISRRNTAK